MSKFIEVTILTTLTRVTINCDRISGVAANEDGMATLELIDLGEVTCVESYDYIARRLWKL